MQVISLQKAPGMVASRPPIWRVPGVSSPAPTTVVALTYEILGFVSVILGMGDLLGEPHKSRSTLPLSLTVKMPLAEV